MIRVDHDELKDAAAGEFIAGLNRQCSLALVNATTTARIVAELQSQDVWNYFLIREINPSDFNEIPCTRLCSCSGWERRSSSVNS